MLKDRWPTVDPAYQARSHDFLSSGSGFGAELDKVIYEGPTALMGRTQEESVQAGESQATPYEVQQMELGRQLYQPERAPITAEEYAPKPTTPLLSAEDANAKYGLPGELAFDAPVREGVARLRHDWKREQIERRDILARSDSGVFPGAARGAAWFLGQAVDPLNIASSFIPIVGQARYAAWAARYGRTGARALRGAAEGAVGQAMVEPFTYALYEDEGEGYTALTALLDITFGTVLGGGLHVGLGAVGDALGKLPFRQREQIVRGAVAQLADKGEVRMDAATPAAVRAAQEELMTLYHGSPHTFDRFSTDFMGTGEGAQAYGWGLYFAGKTEVGEYYKKQLARINWANPEAASKYRPEVLEAIRKEGRYKSPDEIIAQNRQYADAARETGERSIMADMHDALASGDIAPVGFLYRADLKASEDAYLDWDKPLSEQSEKVKAALAKLDLPMFRAWQKNGAWEHVHGKTLYDEIARQGGTFTSGMAAGNVGGQQRASLALREAGIPGIKYLDQGSRTGLRILDPHNSVHNKWTVGPHGGPSKTFGTEAEARAYMAAEEAKAGRNYVLFDPEPIRRVHRDDKLVFDRATAAREALAPGDAIGAEKARAAEAAVKEAGPVENTKTLQKAEQALNDAMLDVETMRTSGVMDEAEMKAALDELTPLDVQAESEGRGYAAAALCIGRAG